MKKFITLLFVAIIFVMNSSKAQTAPVAVNDTTWSVFDAQVSITRTFIISNDTTQGGGTLKVDTIFYNGLGVISNVVKNSVSLSSFRYTPPVGFFGKDSVTYYLTNYPTNYGYDTAIIYIYVKRKDYENLDLNNINARVDKNVLFNDPINSVSGFEAPKGSGSNTIYAADFWLAGVDAGGQLKTFGNTYGISNNAGPMNTDDYYSYQWDRVWKVNYTDIQYHIANWNTPGYQPIEVIANWPAHGDTTKGQAYNLAPFVDVDFDGVYNPLLGDYPKIKGQQAIYFIQNDERDTSTQSVINIGVEIHGMVYAYDCPEDSAINNTVFVDYKIYNRSPFTFNDAYFGQWADLDIGFASNDYVGCDVARGTFYAYNGNTIESYNPVQGVTFLKGAQQDNDGIDNPLTTNIPTAISQNGIPYAGLGTGFGDGTVDNEYLGLNHFMYYSYSASHLGDGDPITSSDYYNYLRGNWRDGTHLKWGGNGHYTDPNASIVDANYMFPGDSDPLFWGTGGVAPTPVSWSEITTGNTPSDRRGMGSTGPFTLLAGESVEMELAFVFGIDYNSPGNNLAGITVMNERVDSIRSYHAAGFATTPCGGSILGTKTEVIQQPLLTIYPNPFNSQFIITYQPTSTAVVEVYNMWGSKLVNQPITQKNTIIDLTNQPNGIYVVKVTDGSKVLVKKVVKQ